MKKNLYPKTKYVYCDLIAAGGKMAQGCEVADGKIKPALSAQNVTANAFSRVAAAGFSAAAGGFLLCADKKVFRSQDGLQFEELCDFSAAQPFCFEQREGEDVKLYVAGGGNCAYFGGGAGGLIPFESNIYAGQMKNGRLFGADCDDNFTLRWSGAGGAFDWEEGIDGAGWVRLDGAGGRILNLLQAGEKLIIVRENCLDELDISGSPEKFRLESKNLRVCGVAENSAAAAGGKIYFMAEGGLNVYNGSQISKAPDSVINLLLPPYYAVTTGKKYCVCGYLKAFERRVVAVYDTDNNCAFTVDFPADLLVAGGAVYAYAQGRVCVLASGGGFAYTAVADFGTQNKKYLHSVEAECGRGVEITVCSGDLRRTFCGAKGRIRTDMRGDKFEISIKADGEITRLKAVAEVLDDV